MNALSTSLKFWGQVRLFVLRMGNDIFVTLLTQMWYTLFFQVRKWWYLRSSQILPFNCNLNVGLAAKGLGTRLGDFANGMSRNF